MFEVCDGTSQEKAFSLGGMGVDVPSVLRDIRINTG